MQLKSLATYRSGEGVCNVESVFQLSNLEKLDVSDLKLVALPEEVGNLSLLRELSVGNNLLTSLPERMGRLTSLHSLGVHENRLESLPTSFGRLSSLRTLWAPDNPILDFPREMAAFSQLSFVNLLNCQLTQLPTALGASVKVLKLSRNLLTEIPPTVSLFSCLEQLRVEWNVLTLVSSEVSLISSLTNLRVGRNRLTCIPAELALLSSLDELWVNHNLLEGLPLELLEFTAMKKLVLHKNRLIHAYGDALQRLIDRRTTEELYLASNELVLKPAFRWPLCFPGLAFGPGKGIGGFGERHFTSRYIDEYLPFNLMQNSDELRCISRAVRFELKELQDGVDTEEDVCHLTDGITLVKNALEVCKHLYRTLREKKRCCIKSEKEWMWANVSWCGENEKCWTTLFKPLSECGTTTTTANFTKSTKVRDDVPRDVLELMRFCTCTHYTFQFSSEMEHMVEKAMGEIGWLASDKILGVHLRRGDALGSDLTSGTVCRWGSALEEYLTYVDVMCARYGFDTVYLSTESQDEIDKAKSLRPQYTILSLNISRDFFPSTGTTTSMGTNFIEHMARDDPSMVEPITLSCLLDLHFLHLCNGFIGSYSAFSLYAWYLMVGRLGYVPPFVCL